MHHPQFAKARFLYETMLYMRLAGSPGVQVVFATRVDAAEILRSRCRRSIDNNGQPLPVRLAVLWTRRWRRSFSRIVKKEMPLGQ